MLASSAERAISLAKSDDLRERIISRQHVLSGDFHLKPQSTLIIEGAERLGLKETLVLLGEARAQDAQLVFLDSAGRQANGNAMSVLESAGVARSRNIAPPVKVTDSPTSQLECVNIWICTGTATPSRPRDKMEIKRAINTARYAGCVFSRLRLISQDF